METEFYPVMGHFSYLLMRKIGIITFFTFFPEEINI